MNERERTRRFRVVRLRKNMKKREDKCVLFQWREEGVECESNG